MPGRLDLEFGFSRGAARRDGDQEPKRLLVVGDFGAHATGQRAPLASRRTHRVDVDNLDQVIQRIGPGLRLPGGEIGFAELDDFHPDRLFARLELFQSLRHARANPGAADDDPLGRLLGKPARAPAAVATRASAPATGLDALIRNIVAPHVVPDTSAQSKTHLAVVDAAIAEQMRKLLHDPAFLALESAWRGVHWLVSNLELDESLQLHLLDATRAELQADSVAAQGDPSRSDLLRALCAPSAGAPVHAPWSLLVGLFGFGPGADDIDLLSGLGAVASRAGGAWVAAAAPALFGCGALADLPDPIRWTPLDADAARRWSQLRASAVAPWLGLVAPRLLLRLPYGKATDPIERFAFEEQRSSPQHETLLWGAGALAVALIVGRWLHDDGSEPVTELTDLPAYTFTRDQQVELQPCAEAWLGERAGQSLLALGLMPLLSHRQRAAVRLLRLQSIAEPARALVIDGA